MRLCTNIRNPYCPKKTINVQSIEQRSAERYSGGFNTLTDEVESKFRRLL